tara:strand:- start:16523 stop:16987 length:465 start_codon:yes stop_codon:yes gene_type:complete
MNYRPILKWWLIICAVTLLTVAGVYFFDLHIALFNADVTKLSFVIISIFIATSAWIGSATRGLLYKELLATKDLSVGWFIAESMMALGMIGTVVGFLLMLGTAFGNIDVNDTESLQIALTSMATGMSTALYTTLTGLVCSLLIKVQLVNYESHQ